jgi:hypothetical protein
VKLMAWARDRSAWLRAHSEHFLQEAAERDVAARYGRPPPVVRRRVDDLFWRHVFVPVYRAMPWRLRLRILHAMPGSHRRQWRGG